MKYAAFGDGQRHVDALFHEHDGHAVVGHPSNDREQLADDDRCEAQRQLVDQQHLRAHHEAHREREHLLLAARHVRRRRVESVGEHREHLQHLGGGCSDTRLVAPIGPAGEFEVLANGQRPEHALAAGHLDDAERSDLVRRGVRDVSAIEHDGTAVSLDDAADRLQQGRLAGAVRTEEGDDLALVEVQVDAVEHRAIVVAGLDAAKQQQVGVALAAIEEHLGTGRRRLPHLGDVVVDHVADAAQDEAPDHEVGDQEEHADLDAPVVRDPADHRENREAGDDPQRSDGEAGRPRPRWNGERQRSQHPGPDDGESGRDHAVECNGDEDVGGECEAGCRHRRDDGDRRDETNQALDVADEPARGDSGADDEPDERERLGDGRGDASTAFVETELLVVEQRGERAETDQRRGQERQTPPDPLQRLDLVGGAPTLGERRRLLLGVDDFL